MKKILYFVVLFLCFIPLNVFAQRGCCSHHGGVAGCSSTGRQICKDGTLSPSCTCQAPVVYGCMDPKAINYNSKANKNNGSCKYKVYGCIDKKAINYNPSANTSDNSCEYKEKITEKEVIEYETIKKDNQNEQNTYEQIIQKGQNGEKEITYEIIKDSNNNIKSKTIIKENILMEPVDEIIEIGSIENIAQTISINNVVMEQSKNNLTNAENTTNSKSIPAGLWLICIIFIIVYRCNFDENKSLLYRISKCNKNKVIYYICYFLLVIPVFVDTIIIITEAIKMKLHKKII